MAKQIKNKRCPLQNECGRKCENVGTEIKCDYYRNNGIGDNAIPDQEELREQMERSKANKDYEPEIAELMKEEDEAIAENKLVYIPIDELYAHPDNPRKDLGDLSELADSIKAKGVMQNLTVVKGHFEVSGLSREMRSGGYTVIIGHRRMGAAKIAGLKELPCVIVEMSHKDQLGTMLLENMQRSDLTVYEQAQGFQMMMDFGESIESISEKTGFSQTTVRRRIKLAELDGDKLKKASTRQITLDDLDRLSKIENIDKRNELLEIIGTSNFDYSYKQAITRQEEEKNSERWRAVLVEKGLKELSYNDIWNGDKYRNSSRSFATLSTVAPSEFVVAEDMQFFAFNRGTIYFRRERNEDDRKEAAAWQRKQEKQHERKAALDEITKRAYELRKDFVDGISESSAKNFLNVIIEYNIQKDWSNVDNYGWNNGYDTSKFPGRVPNANGIDSILQQIKDAPFRSFLFHTYLRWSDDEKCGYVNYNGEWVDNKRLNFIYEFLEKLGYEISDEERSMMNGENPLFTEDNEEQEDESEDFDADEEIIEDEDSGNDDQSGVVSGSEADDMSEDEFDNMIRNKLKETLGEK